MNGMSTETLQFLLSPVCQDLQSTDQSTFNPLDDVKTIYEQDVGFDPPSPKTRSFNISTTSSSRNIRLIDCAALTERDVLRVLEFADFPTIPYSTISTPWQGMIQPPSDQHRLSVEGAEEADPIAIELLKQACKASLLRECCYLWLDRLCIVQTDASDKNWHIQHMHRLYRSSTVCFVLPGGTHRLVRLDEETPWVHRSWTLQEALAPPEVMVLFGWELEPGYGIVEVVPGHSAMASLDILVRASVVGYMALSPASADLSSTTPVHVAVSVFGPPLSKRPDTPEPSWRIQHRPLSPSVVALEIALDARSKSPDQLAHAIWQSAVLRTCTRPVDTIFSIMGLLGVTLDPAAFKADDRRGATIALAQAILQSGGSASWLGAAFHIPPDRYLSSFPTFPSPDAKGAAHINIHGMMQAISDMFGQPVELDVKVPIPNPSAMDDEGYLHFTARAIRVRAAEKEDLVLGSTIRALDGSQWVYIEDHDSNGRHGEVNTNTATYVSLSGRFERRYMGVGVNVNYVEDDIVIMVLEEHRPGLFHARTFCLLSSWIEDYEKDNGCRTWEEREFCVGGPDDIVSANHMDHRVLHCPHQSLRPMIPAKSLDTAKNLYSLSNFATPCRIRLIDCQALVEQGLIHVTEFPDVVALPYYSAISYPWRGVSYDQSNDIEYFFAVDGAPDADPVSVNVLRHACVASLLRGCPYLWVDRLCIIQTDRSDKRWQIQHMHKAYQSCRLCIILPGGIHRLVRLDEETSWIHRSWTLQEALAPSESTVLFDWKLGWGMSGTEEDDPALFWEVVPGESAMAPLSLILQGCTVGCLEFEPSSTSRDVDRPAVLVQVSLFNTTRSIVHDTASASGDVAPARSIFSSNVVALSIAMDRTLTVDPDVRAHAIWQSALMRTSSRPVDMVFSIMGLFGVTLDPAAFHQNDRRGATIALAQTLLRLGGSASWLGAAFYIEPDRTLSTFPTFPRTSVAGTAQIELQGHTYEVHELVGYPVYPVSRMFGFLPKGSMDDAGYLSFRTRAVKFRRASNPDPDDRQAQKVVYEAIDGSKWQSDDEAHGDKNLDATRNTETLVYGALLGHFDKYFPGKTPAYRDDNIRLMILEEHAPGAFHLRTFCFAPLRDKENIETWPIRLFCVGPGPDTRAMHGADKVDAGQTGDQSHTMTGASAGSRLLPRRGPGQGLETRGLERHNQAVRQRVLEQLRYDAYKQCPESEYFVWIPTLGTPSDADLVQ